MDDVAFAIDHYVAIMAISYREQVCEDTVGRQAADKVGLGLLKATSKVPLVKLTQVGQLWFFHTNHFFLQCVD